MKKHTFYFYRLQTRMLDIFEEALWEKGLDFEDLPKIAGFSEDEIQAYLKMEKTLSISDIAVISKALEITVGVGIAREKKTEMPRPDNEKPTDNN